jgi:hypothetical protein
VAATADQVAVVHSTADQADHRHRGKATQAVTEPQARAKPVAVAAQAEPVAIRLITEQAAEQAASEFPLIHHGDQQHHREKI